MQKITRRPQKKNARNVAKTRDKRRLAKREKHEHQRKLARKLTRMATQIDKGNYRGIANSPLLHLNWDFVIRRSLIANSSWKKALLKG